MFLLKELLSIRQSFLVLLYKNRCTVLCEFIPLFGAFTSLGQLISLFYQSHTIHFLDPHLKVKFHISPEPLLKNQGKVLIETGDSQLESKESRTQKREKEPYLLIFICYQCYDQIKAQSHIFNILSCILPTQLAQGCVT